MLISTYLPRYKDKQYINITVLHICDLICYNVTNLKIWLIPEKDLEKSTPQTHEIINLPSLIDNSAFQGNNIGEKISISPL